MPANAAIPANMRAFAWDLSRNLALPRCKHAALCRANFHRGHCRTSKSILGSESSLMGHDALHRLFRAPSRVLPVVLAPYRMLQLSAGVKHIVGVLQQQRGQVQARLCCLVYQRLSASQNRLVAPNSLRPHRDRVCRRSAVLGVRYAQLRWICPGSCSSSHAETEQIS